MKRIQGTAFLSLSLFLLQWPVSASGGEKFQAGGHFLLGFPKGEFKKNVDGNGLGGDFSFAYRFPRTPLSAGISFGFLVYGHESRVESLSPSIPDLLVEVGTTNSILLCHMFLRLQPERGIVRPYLDGLAGLNYLTTDTSIDDLNDGDEGGHLSSNNYNDLAFSYGVGGGAMVSVLRVVRGDRDHRIFSMDLDVGVRYLKGGEAEYLKKGSIRREDGVVYYDVSSSRTDLLKAYIGLSFFF
jgi:hypothetical protein